MGKIRRRLFLIAAVALVAAPGQLLGQISKSVPRVAIVSAGTRDAHSTQVAAFVRGMREQGYEDGRNVVFDARFADGKIDRLPEIFQELLEQKPDVIVTAASQPVRAAMKATSTVPIVFATIGDPVGQGLVASLARPGGNVTGLAILAEVLVTKRLELLKEILPKALRFGHLLNSKNSAQVIIGKQAQIAATKLGIELLDFDATTSAELDITLAAIATQRPHAVIVAEDVLFFNHRKKIAVSLLQNRIPSIHGFPESAIEGGLISYAINFDENFRRAATYVNKILKGAKPGELPIEQPMRYELAINMKTAKELGLTIPQLILIRTDRVIE